MFSIISNIINAILNVGTHFARNKIINSGLTKAISLLLSGAVAMGVLKENDANVIASLLSGADIGYVDLWVFCINIGALYCCYQGIKLFFKYVNLKIENRKSNKNKE